MPVELNTVREKDERQKKTKMMINDFLSLTAGILDLKPEGLQAAFNVTVVGGLAASQQVNI